MKLRLMMGWCALAAAALGEESVVTGQNICGLMNVPSASQYTMIAVPWVTVGNSAEEATMKVANLVKTDTLTAGDETTAGDELYYYNGETYFRWVLKTDSSGGRAWTPTATTLKDAKGADVTITAPGADYALNRGKGLFLVRKDTSAEIWLYGQYDASAVSVAVTAGTTSAPTYTMIANPNATDYDLNGTDTKVTGAVGDQILLGDGGLTLYTYKTDGWTKTTTTTVKMGNVDRTVKDDTTKGVTIPAGQGAWYVSKGGSPTITWASAAN